MLTQLSSDGALWHQWITSVYSLLRAGKHLDAPEYLAHPTCCGFGGLLFAEPVGQTADYALSLKDGSRLHIHELPGHRFRVHLDRFDPAHSAEHFVAHLVHETKTGSILLAFAGLAFAGYVVRRLLRG